MRRSEHDVGGYEPAGADGHPLPRGAAGEAAGALLEAVAHVGRRGDAGRRRGAVVGQDEEAQGGEGIGQRVGDLLEVVVADGGLGAGQAAREAAQERGRRAGVKVKEAAAAVWRCRCFC